MAGGITLLAAVSAATSGDPLLTPLVLAESRTTSQLRQDLSQVRYHARAKPHRAVAAIAKAAENYGTNLGGTIDGATVTHSWQP